EVAVRLAVAPTATTPDGSRRWIDAVARAAARADAIVVFDLGDDPRTSELLPALSRAGGERPAIAIVDEPVAAREGVIVHVAPLLDPDGTRALAASMLGREPPRAWAEALHAASGGLPLTAIELVRSIADE